MRPYGCARPLSVRLTVESEAGTTVGEASLAGVPGLPAPPNPQPVPVLPMGVVGLSALLLPALFLTARRRTAPCPVMQSSS